MVNVFMIGYVVGVEVLSRSNKEVFIMGVNLNRIVWLCLVG